MCRMAHFGNCDPETADQEYCIFHKPDKTEEEVIEFYRKFLKRFKPKIEEIEVNGEKKKRLVFKEPIDARGFVFPDANGINFRGTIFERGARFDGAIFKEFISFQDSEFKEGIPIFDKLPSEEKISASFNNAQFLKGVSFKGSTFYGNTWFRGAMFKLCADFNNAIFEGNPENDVVDFSGAIFKSKGERTINNPCLIIWRDNPYGEFPENTKYQVGSAVFRDTTFKIQANFNNVIFDGVDFRGAEFKNRSNFREVKFNGSITLYGTSRFEDRVSFQDSIFNSQVRFSVDIEHSEFNSDVDFENVRFNERVGFQLVEFKGDVTFNGSIFAKLAIFIERERPLENEPQPKFHKGLSFSNCDFRQGVDFMGSLENETDISRLWDFFNSRFPNLQALIEALRVQRLSFEKEGKREEADRIFVIEMRAKRKLRMLRAKENLTNAKGFKNNFEAILKYMTTWIGVQTEKILADGVSEYGTNWKKTLLASADVIMWSALLYNVLSPWFSLGKIVDYNGKPVTGVLNHLYYSLVTFTTLGYGDMHPTGWLKALSAIEALTGAVFMALIVAVIARRWMR